MKDYIEIIKQILSVWDGQVLVITKDTSALGELKNAGISGMHRNQEPGEKPLNLINYPLDAVVIKITAKNNKYDE